MVAVLSAASLPARANTVTLADIMIAAFRILGVRRCLFCCLQVAVACIKVASQAVASMPSLLFWPLVPFLAICVLVVYWVAVSAFLFSSGTIVPQQLQASASGPISLSVSMLLAE